MANHFPESLRHFEESQLSTFNGLPAHVLLVHFIVVLGPLTAVLAIVCTFWPAARQRLVWLDLRLAVVTAALTPLTQGARRHHAASDGRCPPFHAHHALGGPEAHLSIPHADAGALH